MCSYSSMKETIIPVMKQLSKLQIMVYNAGAVVMLLALVAFSTPAREYVPYVFGAGAACFAAMQLSARYEGGSFTVRRLRRQQILGALVLLVTAVPMWMSVRHVWPFGHNEWLVFLTVGAWLELYTAFRIPSELKKERNDNTEQ